MDEPPLKGFPLFLGALALSLCTFMQVLDYSIANVSIPYIAGDLAVSTNDGTWVITLFAVGNATALPLTGWLTRRFGSIRILILSILFFTLFSWLCGMAPCLEMLIVMRYIQGFVAGPLIPLSQSLMLLSFSEKRKNLALAIWNMVAVVGPMAGPILGGWITYDYAWPWIFFINIPVGIFCVCAIWRVYKKRETPFARVSFDVVGLLLLAFGIAATQIAIDQGQQLDWWNSPLIWMLTVIAILSFVFFVLWELKEPHPVIDLRFFKNRNFFMGTVLVSLSYMLLFGVIVVTPLWLQEQMGYTALLAGLAVSTMGLIPFLAVVLLAKLMNRCSLKYLVLFSFLSYALALFFFSTFTTDVTFEKVAFSRLLLGVGISMWLAPLTALTFAHFSREKLAEGQGVFHFFRIFMGGIGTSVFITLWERRAMHHHSHLIDALRPKGPLFFDLSKLQLVRERALAAADRIIWKQAYMLSINDIFWAGGYVFIFFCICALFFKKKGAFSREIKN